MVSKLVKIGEIINIKDNLISCSNKSSSSFIGEKVLFTSIYNIDEVLGNGIIFEANEVTLKIFLLDGKQANLTISSIVLGTGEGFYLNIGFQLLGVVIDSLGNELSKTSNNLFFNKLFDVDKVLLTNESPSIIYRKKVCKSLFTGILSIDTLIPVGLGQRQLIIGDNNLGKTSLALTVVLNQRHLNDRAKISYYKRELPEFFIPCIYVSIGQKRSELLRIENVLVSNLSS